jgi:flagellar basal-body rod protein FlgB
MAISEFPILSMLRTKMQWHQERQRILAENVANTDTPQFQPRDLTPPSFEPNRPAAVGSIALAVTDPAHRPGSIAGTTRFTLDTSGGFEVRPTGNSVDLEDQMMKVAANNMDYQAATQLYTRSLALIKIAFGTK